MVVQISVAIIAVAFVILVIFLVNTLRSLTALLTKTSHTLTDIEIQFAAYSKDTGELLRHSKEIAADVRDKLNTIDTGFAAIKHTVDAAKEITSSVRQVSAAVAQRFRMKTLSKQEE